MSDLFTYSEGGTPLDPDEIEGLIPTHIVNRGQLDELEQENILSAQLWLTTARMKKINTDTNLRNLHKKMLGNVWNWAGKYRLTGKNIGIEARNISVELRNLCDDVDTWIEFSTYSEDEIAARFHHKLVYIHAFPNGNGRHARLAADVLLTKQLDQASFTWGSVTFNNRSKQQSEIRREYIDSLRDADRGDYGRLMEFVRS